MTGESFEALAGTIERIAERVEGNENDFSIVFLQTRLDTTDEVYSGILNALSDLCTEPDLRPTESDTEEVRYDIFDQIQEIQRSIEGVRSEDVPFDLYYLLEDFTLDLGIDVPIVVSAGNSSDIYIQRLLEKFRIATGIVPNLYGEVGESQHHILEFQRSELIEPESYPLLIHELFHVSDIWQELSDTLERKTPEIPENEREEVSVDLLSVNYLGPAYAVTTARMPDKVGDHRDWVHPSKDTRIKYLLCYLEYLESRPDSPSNILDKKTINSATEELEKRLNEAEVDYTLEEYNEVQKVAEEILEENGTPSYLQQRSNMRGYLGMPDADNEQLLRMVNRLFLNTEENQEVALPVKPLLLLNLIPLMEDTETSELAEVFFTSFRKWFVRRKTSEDTGRRIIQIPDIKS